MTLPTRRLHDVVRGLPGVKPNLAAATVRQALGVNLDAPSSHKVITDEPPLFEIIPGSYGVFVVLRPAGVRRVLDMYASGAFQLQRGAIIAAPSEDLVRFAALLTAEDIEAEDQRLDALDATRPVTFDILERAYWRWADRACPHPRGSLGAKEWLAAASFVYRNISYRRIRNSMASNSGKTKQWWTEFYGRDGSCFSEGQPPANRRHDPNRNFGLGRE